MHQNGPCKYQAALTITLTVPLPPPHCPCCDQPLRGGCVTFVAGTALCLTCSQKPVTFISVFIQEMLRPENGRDNTAVNGLRFYTPRRGIEDCTFTRAIARFPLQTQIDWSSIRHRVDVDGDLPFAALEGR